MPTDDVDSVANRQRAAQPSKVIVHDIDEGISDTISDVY